MTHAYNPEGEWNNQHLMAVNGKFFGISRDDLLAVAERFGIGTAPQVLKQVGVAVSSWLEFAAQAKVGPSDRERIRAHQRVI